MERLGRWLRNSAASICGFLLVGFSRSGQRPGMPEVRLAATLGSFGHLPLHLAGAFGYFQDEGVTVTLAEMAGSSKVRRHSWAAVPTLELALSSNRFRWRPKAVRSRAFSPRFFNIGFAIVISPKASNPDKAPGRLRGARVGVGFYRSWRIESLRTRTRSCRCWNYDAKLSAAASRGHPGTSVLFDPLPNKSFERPSVLRTIRLTSYMRGWTGLSTTSKLFGA